MASRAMYRRSVGFCSVHPWQSHSIAAKEQLVRSSHCVGSRTRWRVLLWWMQMLSQPVARDAEAPIAESGTSTWPLNFAGQKKPKRCERVSLPSARGGSDRGTFVAPPVLLSFRSGRSGSAEGSSRAVLPDDAVAPGQLLSPWMDAGAQEEISGTALPLGGSAVLARRHALRLPRDPPGGTDRGTADRCTV